MSDEVLTAEEAATILKVTAERVRIYVRQGKLKAKKIGSGKSSPVRIFADSVREMLRGEHD